MSQHEHPVTLMRVWVRENIITTVLIIFILVSLVLHAVTIGALMRVRGIVNRQLDLSVTQLEQVRQQKIRYNFPIDQTFRIDTTVAISETVNVPLNLSVPISDTVAIPIRRDIPFQTDVPIKTDIPIDINLQDPPLGDVLRKFEDALRELRDLL